MNEVFAELGHSRDLFEVDNAKALYPTELASTFVATSEFWRLLSAKNHIVLGSRGSGKTALIKMLAHEYLSRFRQSRAQDTIRSASYVGIYIPMNLDWVGALKNKPWVTEAEGEYTFQWRLNLAACAAFLVSLESCLRAYRRRPGDRARTEYRIISEISHLWAHDAHAADIRGMRQYLRRIIASRGREARAARVAGLEPQFTDKSSLDEELFAPLRWAAEVAGEELSLSPSTAWLICIDEAELLRPFQQRIMNTVIRAASGQFFYKMTTLPYGHYTLATNADRDLEVGHDFEYVRIDRDPVNDRDTGLTNQFVRSVYRRRQRLSIDKYPPATLVELFGPSRLLEPGRGRWPTYEAFADELDNHLVPSAAYRARELLRRDRGLFASQIARRMRGTIELRLALRSRPGHQNLDIYAGTQLFVRCADGNPRRIIRLFKMMLDRAPAGLRRRAERGEPMIPASIQTEVLISFSAEALFRARSEEHFGFDVFRLIQAFGEFANASTHAPRITTDAVTTVRVDPLVTDRVWAAVTKACDLGLLYANVTWKNPDQWPTRSGFFHLAYVLAPHFRVLPRRGRSRNLSMILRDSDLDHGSQLLLFDELNDD
jgi:hypothetical protein